MKEKLIQALLKVYGGREEATDISSSGNEYYFRYKGRYFSVLKENGIGRFYVYPRFSGPMKELIGALEHGIEHPDLAYVSLTSNDLANSGHEDVIGQLHSWLEERYLGLDDLFADLGIR